MRIGEVQSFHLAKDLTHIDVEARLVASAKNMAYAGSQFWIVRPEVGVGGLHGLETIISGPYIQVEPRVGAVQKNSLAWISRQF